MSSETLGYVPMYVHIHKKNKVQLPLISQPLLFIIFSIISTAIRKAEVIVTLSGMEVHFVG